MLRCNTTNTENYRHTRTILSFIYECWSDIILWFRNSFNSTPYFSHGLICLDILVGESNKVLYIHKVSKARQFVCLWYDGGQFLFYLHCVITLRPMILRKSLISKFIKVFMLWAWGRRVETWGGCDSFTRSVRFQASQAALLAPNPR